MTAGMIADICGTLIVLGMITLFGFAIWCMHHYD